MNENLPVNRTNFTPTNFEQAERFSALVAKTDFAPKEYKNNPGNVLVAMVFGSEIGLSPMQSLQNIAVINGKPSIYGDAALALVLAHHTCEYVNETYDTVTLTATCKCKRRGQQHEYIEKFSQKDAQTAGLWGKAGPWTQYPRRMLTMRARGFALRNVWPDVLKGIITREEAQDYPTPSKMDTVAEAEYQLSEDMGKNANLPPPPEIDKKSIVKKYLSAIAGHNQAGQLDAWWKLNYKTVKFELGDNPEGRGGGPEYTQLYSAMLARKKELTAPATTSPAEVPPFVDTGVDVPVEIPSSLGENEVVCPDDATIKHKENDCIRGACSKLNTCEAWG